MNTPLKHFLALLLACFFTHSNSHLYAQKVWTLRECIEYALTNNLSIKQNELTVDNQRILLDQAKWARYPNLNGQLGTNSNFGFSVNPITNTLQNQANNSVSVGLNTSVTLFNGFRLSNNIKLQELNVKASEYDLSAIRNTVSLTVANSYLNVLFNQEQSNISQIQHRLTQKQIDRMKKLVDAGSVSRDNLLNLEAQYANEELQLVTRQNQIELAILSLEQQLQIPHSESFRIDARVPKDEFQQIDVPSLDIVFNEAQELVPELKGAKVRLDAARINEAIASASRYPSVSLSAGLSTLYSDQAKVGEGLVLQGYNPIGFVRSNSDTVIAPNYGFERITRISLPKQIKNNFGNYVSFSVNIPIFNGFSVRSQINTAQIGIKQQELQTLNLKNQLYQTVSQAYFDYKAATEQLKANRQNVAAQKNNYEFAQKRFEQGLMNSVDFLSTQNNYQVSLSNLLQAKYTLLFRSKILDFYRGKAIDL